MQYIIAYDISSSKRLAKVAKILLDYGYRIQHSIFIVHLESLVFEQLKRRIEKAINQAEDKIMYFNVCERCMKNALFFGMELMTQKEYLKKDFYIV